MVFLKAQLGIKSSKLMTATLGILAGDKDVTFEDMPYKLFNSIRTSFAKKIIKSIGIVQSPSRP